MVKKDKVQVTLEIDGKQGINELGKLEMEAKDLRASLKDLKKGTEEYNQANEKLKTATAEMGRMREQMGLAGMTMRQLSSYQRDLQTQWNGLTKGTDQWKQVDSQLKQVNATINQQRAELKGTAGVWGFLKSEIGKFGVLAVGALGFDAIIGKINNLISRSAKLSDAMSDLRMTTGLSAEAADAYNKSLSSLNTRTSREDLLGIGKIAGQFGVANSELKDFTEQMNKTTVVLSSEFSGGAEEITTRMATLRNIFSDIKSDNISEDISHISNAVVVLAQEGVATAPVVSDFANRIGGVGINLGLTTPQVLGLSAAMQEVGITAERGGTAVGKILQKMTTNTDEFAKVAGMKLKDFSDLVNKDIYSAFLKVLEGSKKGGEGAIVLGRLIKDLEISGAGASEVFSKLGNNMGLLANRTELAGKAIQSTSAITEQYNQKNENFAANLEKVQKVVAALFMNSAFIEGMQTFMAWLIKINEVKISDTLKQEQAEFNMLATAVMNTNDEYGTRDALLKELIEKYPDYFKGLDAEKLSNTQLQQILEDVNKEYAKKIFLRQNEEKMSDFMEKEIAATKLLVEANKSLANIKKEVQTVAIGGSMVGTNNNSGFQEKQFAEILVTKIQKSIDDIRAQRIRFVQEQNELAKAMGVDMGPNKGGPVAPDPTKTTTTTITSGETEAEKKAREKRKEANEKALEETRKHLADIDQLLEDNDIKRELTLLEKTEKELQIIDNKYNEEIVKAGKFEQDMLNNDNLSKAQKIENSKLFEVQISALEEQWRLDKAAKIKELEEAEAAKKLEVQEKIRTALLSDNDREIEAIKDKYQALIDEAEKYGIGTIAIYEAMYTAINAAKGKQAKADAKADAKVTKEEKQRLQERNEAYINATSATANAVASIMEASGANSKEMAAFQSSIALAEVLINQGVAISKAVAANANSPDPITFGLRVAASIATIVGAMANAYNSINKATIPDAPDLTKSTPKPNNFYYGGETGGPPLGYDQNGAIVGGVHANEYVVPSFVRHRPAVINATRVIEAERQSAMGRNGIVRMKPGGGSSVTSHGESSGDGAGELLEEFKAMRSDLRMLMQRQANKKVYFVANDKEKFDKEQDRIKFLAQG